MKGWVDGCNRKKAMLEHNESILGKLSNSTVQSPKRHWPKERDEKRHNLLERMGKVPKTGEYPKLSWQEQRLGDSKSYPWQGLLKQWSQIPQGHRQLNRLSAAPSGSWSSPPAEYQILPPRPNSLVLSRDKGEHSPAGPHSLGAQHPLLPEPRGVQAPRPLLPQTQESSFPGFPHIHEAGPPFPFPWIQDSKSSASPHLKSQEPRSPALSHLRFQSWALSVLPGPAGPQGPHWGRNA